VKSVVCGLDLFWQAHLPMAASSAQWFSASDRPFHGESGGAGVVKAVEICRIWRPWDRSTSRSGVRRF